MALDNMIRTDRKGVFFLEHPSRKNGVRKDRQYILRYTINSRTFKGVFGWESEGKTLPDAEKKIQQYRANAKSGDGPISLEEEKTIADQLQANKEKAANNEKAKNIIVGEYFESDYMEAAIANKKPRTVGSEKALYEKWIQPIFGDVPIREIVPWHFEKLKQKVLKGDRVKDKETGEITYKPKSARTVHYCVSIVIQIWNMAFDNKIVEVMPPRRSTLKLPMIDNERTRAFTADQAIKLLAKIKDSSEQWNDIAMVALFAGLRASEVFRLEVKDFDKDRGLIFLRTPKKHKSQKLVLNESALKLFTRLVEGRDKNAGLIFLNNKGEQVQEVSNSVQRAVDALGFNDGVTDTRDRLTFHSLRHTYATWLLDSGADIHTVSQLLRHSNLSMTNRYVHPQEERLRVASRGIDLTMNGGE